MDSRNPEPAIGFGQVAINQRRRISVVHRGRVRPARAAARQQSHERPIRDMPVLGRVRANRGVGGSEPSVRIDLFTNVEHDEGNTISSTRSASNVRAPSMKCAGASTCVPH
jgi:hypothetical protein